mmetsp:Transcript_2093/g.4768  ORF Transcript_2093/g.4768 Transcript_2093/m.4768 type:complete len:295 (-) Transcript_2093:414-1298(-)
MVPRPGCDVGSDVHEPVAAPPDAAEIPRQGACIASSMCSKALPVVILLGLLAVARICGELLEQLLRQRSVGSAAGNAGLHHLAAVLGWQPGSSLCPKEMPAVHPLARSVEQGAWPRTSSGQENFQLCHRGGTPPWRRPLLSAPFPHEATLAHWHCSWYRRTWRHFHDQALLWSPYWNQSSDYGAALVLRSCGHRGYPGPQGSGLLLAEIGVLGSCDFVRGPRQSALRWDALQAFRASCLLLVAGCRRDRAEEFCAASVEDTQPGRLECCHEGVELLHRAGSRHGHRGGRGGGGG